MNHKISIQTKTSLTIKYRNKNKSIINYKENKPEI